MALSQDISVATKRDGKIMNLSIFKLLVGDVIQINTGDQVPADCILISGSHVQANESNITGEPKNLEKHPIESIEEPDKFTDPFLVGGSQIMEGKGEAVVCAVGKNSQQGKAQECLMAEDESKTPLQAKLEVIADQIGKVGVYCALLTFLACCVNLIITKIVNSEPVFSVATLGSLVQFMLIGITIVVVAVPEGLPLAVTISLAYSVMKMKNEQNLVRRLDASETMGGANQICSDKTGTLTQNKMTVVTVWIEGEHVQELSKVSATTKDLFMLNCCVNSNANLAFDEKAQKEVTQGSQSECALLQYCRSQGTNYVGLRNDHKEIGSIPFSSQRKKMTTIIKVKTDKEVARVFVKGAAEIILERSTSIITQKGQTEILSGE